MAKLQPKIQKHLSLVKQAEPVPEPPENHQADNVGRMPEAVEDRPGPLIEKGLHTEHQYRR